MPLNLQSPVSMLRGVGEARQRALEKLGICTVLDLLHHYPRGYQRRGDVRSVSEALSAIAQGETSPVSLILTVSAEPKPYTVRRGMSLVRVRAFDESGVCEITFFNQNFLRNVFHTGDSFRFFGRAAANGKKLQMTSPIWEPVVPGKELPAVVPVYPLTAGISQKFLAQLVEDVLQSAAELLPETLPESVRQEHTLCTLPYAVQNMHRPADTEALATARRRLLFEEYFEMGLAMAALTSGEQKTGIRMPDTDVTPFLRQLPYTLTGAQQRSVREIAADLSGGFRMNRILMGDVGSGKTAVAAAALYMAAKNGYQTALMAPTEILAVQHYHEIAPLLSVLGMRVTLLTGSLSAAERKAARASIAGATADVAIGTHALLADDVRFARLGLVIEDEQHCFGVAQRAALPSKGENVHMLVMSATPIPRTLSLAAYGGLPVSRLDEMPPGRQRVDTFVVNEGYRERLNGFIRRQVEAGRQVYIVCPSVEENPEKKEKIPDDPEELIDWLMAEDPLEKEEKPPLRAAVDYAATLSRDVFPDFSVAFVHGKMKPAEKDRVMRAFGSGEIQILVSTTVIEVGVNVPNATLMVIENAERFGLSQLHQLRGRVGRGDAKSYCVLVSDSTTETAVRRLDVLRRNYDGYAIAEADLRLRGPGDFLMTDGAVRQHGASSLKMVGGEADTAVLEAAMCAAKQLLERDPTLRMPENAALREAVETIRNRAQNTLN